MGFLDVITRVTRLDDGIKQIQIEDNQDFEDGLYRRIHIGTLETPPNELGLNGDLYIYKPNR